MRQAWLSVAVALVILAGMAAADSIAVKGAVYKDVYLRETDTRYYIQIPREGRTISVDKAQVRPETVSITEDEAVREALLKTWNENYAKRHPKPAAKPDKTKSAGSALAAPSPAPETAVPMPPAPRGVAMASVVNPATKLPSGSRADDLLKGIRERASSVESGVPKLVLRGNVKKDPERDQMLVERALAEQAAFEAEMAREERAYLEFLYGPIVTPNPAQGTGATPVQQQGQQLVQQQGQQLAQQQGQQPQQPPQQPQGPGPYQQAYGFSPEEAGQSEVMDESAPDQYYEEMDAR